MAIRDTLARWFAPAAKASIIGLDTGQLPNQPLEKGFDDATLLSTYGDDAWPYIVGNKVAEQASQAPLQIGRLVRSGDAEDFRPVGPDHPVQALFDAPNTAMDGGEFVALLILYMGFAGHVPIEVVRPNGGGVIGARRNRSGFELWLHNPGPWRIVANPDRTIKGYLWLVRSGADLTWQPDQMTYLRWPNPNDEWYGQGHISAIRQAVMAEEYAALRDKTFERNLGVPPGVLSFDLPLGEPQAAEIQKRWQAAVGGYRNAGKVAVLGARGTYTPVALNARDAEWLAQRLNRVEIIAGAWGMPLPLIRMQDATFNNVAEARSELWEGTLQPRLNRIARMLTWKLLPLITSERLVARFDYAQIEALGENDLQAAKTAGEWSKTGAVTVNEVRTRLGLAAHPDVSIGERLIVPTKLALQSSEDVTAPPEPVRPTSEPVSRKALDPTSRDTLMAPIRAAYRADLAAFFAAQRNALQTSRLAKALPADGAGSLIERAIEILTARRWRERLARISRGPIEASLTLGADAAAGALGIETSFAIPASEAALDQVTRHLDALGVGIANTTVAEVREVLSGALREGLDHAGVQGRLGDLFDGYQDWRLDRISRTETTNAYNLGSVGQYRLGGVSQVDVVDGDLDAPCAAANGSRWSLDEAEGNPSSHPNCTRTFIPVTEGL